MDHLGMAYSTESNGIDYAMYGDGWTIFSFILNNSGENSNCFELIKDGTTSLYMRFANTIPAGGVSLIA
jgi:negative regulator of sigma E activity